MAGYGGHGRTLGWFELEDFDNEAFEVFAEVGAELVVAELDLLAHFIQVFGGEGGESVEEFVEEDPEGPDVDGVVVLLLEDHLGGHVLVGATEGLPFGLDVLSGPAKVT